MQNKFQYPQNGKGSIVKIFILPQVVYIVNVIHIKITMASSELEQNAIIPQKQKTSNNNPEYKIYSYKYLTILFLINTEQQNINFTKTKLSSHLSLRDCLE